MIMKLASSIILSILSVSAFGASARIIDADVLRASNHSSSISLGSQSQNMCLATPSGTSGKPSFRPLTALDIPTLNQNSTGSSGSVSGTNVITNSNLAQVPAHSYLGNNTGSLANALYLTNTQLTADLNTFSSTLQGLAPASGGGTTNFLRADGTWSAPSGGSAYTFTLPLLNSSGTVSVNQFGSTTSGIVPGSGGGTTNFLRADGAWTTPAGGGSVSSVSVASANGFSGSVATPSTTPAITLSTSVTGLLKGNGTAISAATSGSDYSAGTSALVTGIIKSTTTTGALTIAIAADFPTLNQSTTGNAATATTAASATTATSFAGSLSGDVTGTQGATSVNKINGTSLAGLTTGILKNTTTTGVPSIAIASDFPTLNQNSTGTAANITAASNATLTTVSALSLPSTQVTGLGTASTQSTGTFAQVANNLSDLSSAKTARVNLNVDKFTAVVDTNYTVLATDKFVGITSLTLPRALTLPAASAMNPGQMLIIGDVAGVISTTNTITVTRAGTDTIQGATSYVMVTPSGELKLFTDGVSKWFFDVVGIQRGGTGVTSVTSTPTATAIAGWDSNKNLNANNYVRGLTTVVTAAGTTTLTVASQQIQRFTGTTTQIVVLPDATTLLVGHSFILANRSTGIVTVNANGGGLLMNIPAGAQVIFTVSVNSPAAGTWDFSLVTPNTALQITNNLSDLASAKAARVNLNIDKFTAVADASYTALATDRIVALTSLTLTRTVTLPAANSVNAGQLTFVIDANGSVTSANQIIVAAGGTDTINGAASYTITSTFGEVRLVPDGVSKWSLDVVGIGRGGTGKTTANASFNALAPSQATNSGKYLTTDGTNTSWAAVAGGASPLTTKGDLYGFDTAGNRIPVGANGTVLQADSTQTLGVKWATLAGGGNVTGSASSVDSQGVLFSGTSGTLIKASTLTGRPKLAAGVQSVANIDLTSEVTGTLPTANGGKFVPTIFNYTSSTTLADPGVGCSIIRIRAIGGGGGGGSGRKGVAASAKTGGGGGSAGGWIDVEIPYSTVSSWPLTITIGAGGTGGAAVSTSSTAGNPGGNGGDTSFGTYVTAKGGFGGGGGITTTIAGGAARFGSLPSSGYTVNTVSTAGGQGGTLASAIGVGGSGIAGSGGGAGGTIASGTATSGAAGGQNQRGDAGGTGGATSAVGGAGVNGDTSAPFASPWGSGGGGAGGSSTVGSAGGAGGLYGAAGGGGSSGIDTVADSGAGGAGAPGFMQVITR